MARRRYCSSFEIWEEETSGSWEAEVLISIGPQSETAGFLLDLEGGRVDLGSCLLGFEVADLRLSRRGRMRAVRRESEMGAPWVSG